MSVTFRKYDCDSYTRSFRIPWQLALQIQEVFDAFAHRLFFLFGVPFPYSNVISDRHTVLSDPNPILHLCIVSCLGLNILISRIDVKIPTSIVIWPEELNNVRTEEAPWHVEKRVVVYNCHPQAAVLVEVVNEIELIQVKQF